jgi:hypothetical protein
LNFLPLVREVANLLIFGILIERSLNTEPSLDSKSIDIDNSPYPENILEDYKGCLILIFSLVNVELLFFSETYGTTIFIA